MKLPDVLKMAVEEKDWELVCKVYTGITGIPLSPPPKEVSYADMEISIEVPVPTPNEKRLEIKPAVKGLKIPAFNNPNLPANPIKQEIVDTSSLSLPPKVISALLKVELNTTDDIRELIEERGSLCHLKGIGPSFNDKIVKLISPPIEETQSLDKIPNLVKEEGQATGSDTGVSTRSDCVSPSQNGPPSEDGHNVARKQSMSITTDRENRFQDDLGVFQELRVDTHPELSTPVSERTRTGGLVSVVCSECCKNEMVAPFLARSYRQNDKDNTYRCNGCLTSGR